MPAPESTERAVPVGDLEDGPAVPAQPIVSICIPTYNRRELLGRCLDSVLPQTAGMPAEVIVIDNASTDGTEAAMKGYLERYPNLSYYRNPKNLGYAGQGKCFEYGRGRYTAILCDDDVYAPDALETMIPILSRGDFSFVALNYYGFDTDPAERRRGSAAPEEDIEAKDALEIWDYPSVGHYSGLVLNTQEARLAMPEVWKTFTMEQYQQFRGCLIAVVIHTIKRSKLPGYFIGKRIMGAGRPPVIDYDSLRHICMDTYFALDAFVKKGLLPEERIQRRKVEVLALLPKALVRNGGFLDRAELERVSGQLHGWFDGDPRFAKSARILYWLKYWPVRAIFRLAVSAYRLTGGLRGPVNG
jgi:glycosyltransferase involved in cell wall biosynthesis